MRENEKRAQLVRGVLRRTGTDIAPEWAPGPFVRILGYLAVLSLGVALWLVYQGLAIALKGEGSESLPELALAGGLAYLVCLISWRIARIALANGINFSKLIWVGSFAAPCLAFGVRSFQAGVSARGWLILGSLVLFSIGILPIILRCLQAYSRRRRGYDEWYGARFSLALIVFQIILLILGFWAGDAWFDVIIKV